jgi:hypothetical protein
MAPAGTSTWAPAVATIGLAVLVLLLIAWACTGPSGPDDAEGSDGSDPGSGGGGGGPRRPRRPPPVGPVSWTDFERDFAAYVAGQVRDRSVRPRDFTRSERCGAHPDPGRIGPCP